MALAVTPRRLETVLQQMHRLAVSHVLSQAHLMGGYYHWQRSAHGL